MERRDKTNYYLDIAQTVSERSTCLRRRYGAIIVKNDSIVSTGYNGAPRGRVNCSDCGFCKREMLKIPHGEQYEKCMSKDTVIKMLDGTYKTIEELSNLNEEFWVYSINKSGEIVPAKAFNARKIKKESTLLRIFFDDNTYLDCTPDHKILLISNKYKEAQNLQIGDSLMPMYFNFANYDHESVSNNHKVLKIETISYNDYVYDIEVPEHHNFAVYLGNNSCVFVHNCVSVHAEQNAIFSASREEMNNATLYLSCTDPNTTELISGTDCCMMCKRAIINAGITTVIIRDTKDEYRTINVEDWVKLDE